jgi:hypothetical protein
MLFEVTTTTESVQVTEIEGFTYAAPAPTELARLGKYAVGQIPAAARPLFAEVAVATVVAVAGTVAGTVTGTVTTVVEVSTFHLSFLPTFLQIRGLDAVPAKAPALEQLPPTLAADTCWVGMMIAKTLATTTAIILKVLNIE